MAGEEKIFGGYASKVIDKVLKLHDVPNDVREKVYNTYFDVANRRVALADFGDELIKIEGLNPSQANALAAEIAEKLFRGYEIYFSVEDVLAFVREWKKKGVSPDWTYDKPTDERTASPLSEKLDPNDMPDVYDQDVENEDDEGVSATERMRREVKKDQKKEVFSKKLTVSQQKLSELAGQALDAVGISGLSADQNRRAANVLLTQLKDVRDVTEAAGAYELEVEKGGVGVPRDKAGSLAFHVEDLMRKHKLSFKDVCEEEEVKNEIDPVDVKDIWEEYKERKPTALPVSKRDEQMKRREKIKADLAQSMALKDKLEERSSQNRLAKLLARRTEPTSPVAEGNLEVDEPKKRPEHSSIVNLKKSVPAPRRPIITRSAERKPLLRRMSVTHEEKTKKELKLNTLDDLVILTPSAIRYQGGFTQNKDLLVSKIRGIISRGIHKTKIKQAWRRSQLYQIYMEMGRQSVFSGKSVNELAEFFKSNNKPYLTDEEFEIIADISKTLHFE